MKKQILVIIFLAVVISTYVLVSDRNHTVDIQIRNKQFQAEIASTDESRTLGLGQRKSLDQDKAMLFIFPQKGYHGFWMKDMRFDLDIIWITDGRIVYIAKNVSHQDLKIITPDIEAERVLEINSGLSTAYGFEIGDAVENR